MNCSRLEQLQNLPAEYSLPLPQPYAGKVASLRQLAGELGAEIALLDTVLGDLLAGHEGYAAIQQLPGIGRRPKPLLTPTRSFRDEYSQFRPSP